MKLILYEFKVEINGSISCLEEFVWFLLYQVYIIIDIYPLHPSLPFYLLCFLIEFMLQIFLDFIGHHKIFFQNILWRIAEQKTFYSFKAAIRILHPQKVLVCSDFLLDLGVLQFFYLDFDISF